MSHHQDSKVSPRKKQKVEASSDSDSPFGMLDDDALRCVLIRANADDHASLRRTCKRFRKTIDKPLFRRERALLEGNRLDIRVELVDSFEQYKQDNLWQLEEYEDKELYEDSYGNGGGKIDKGERPKFSRQDKDFLEEYDKLGRIGECDTRVPQFRVFVDHRELKELEIKVTLVPRDCGDFYEVCDAIEGDLLELAQKCFRNDGHCKAQALRQAAHWSDRRFLLYISSFVLPEEYRNDDFRSSVGPRILARMLTGIPLLKDEWSVAMYTPWYQPHLTDVEARDWRIQMKESRYETDNGNGNENEELERKRKHKELVDRNAGLTRYDARMFFRAGFQQITDRNIVQDNATLYLYAVPGTACIDDDEEENETNESKKENKTEKNKGNIQSAPHRPVHSADYARNIHIHEKQPEREQSKAEKEFFDFFRKHAFFREERARRAETEKNPSILQDYDKELAKSVAEVLDAVGEGVPETNGRRPKNELVNELIINSCAAHACAFFNSRHCLELLLGHLSSSSISSSSLSSETHGRDSLRSKALNSYGTDGCTPLMVAVCTLNEISNPVSASNPENAYRIRRRRDFCRFLLEQPQLDPTKVNTMGLTAHGFLQKAKLEVFRWNKSFGGGGLFGGRSLTGMGSMGTAPEASVSTHPCVVEMEGLLEERCNPTTEDMDLWRKETLSVFHDDADYDEDDDDDDDDDEELIEAWH